MYDNLFNNLSKSKFRSKFKLTPKDVEYIHSKGFNVIESHARDFIAKRIAPAYIPNDGKQTPMRGIRYLSPSMLQQLAAADVLQNGIKYLKGYHFLSQSRSIW